VRDDQILYHKTWLNTAGSGDPAGAEARVSDHKMLYLSLDCLLHIGGPNLHELQFHGIIMSPQATIG